MENNENKEGAVVAPAENKMGTMPVGRLLVQISLPMMISMLVQALYNIVDSIFVAQISENALTAVSLAFPIQNLMISTSVGTAIRKPEQLFERLKAGQAQVFHATEDDEPFSSKLFNKIKSIFS